jgi:hypothetical protein
MRLIAAGALILMGAASGCADGADNPGGSASASSSGADSNRLTAEESDAVARIERGYPDSDVADIEDPDGVHCIAVKLVTEFGIEKLVKYGVVDDDLEFDGVSLRPMSATDAALFVDIEMSCDPTSFEEGVAEFIRGEERGLSKAAVERCIDAVTEDDVRHAAEGFLREDPEPVISFYDKLRRAGCGQGYSD